ncbi:unnamed protein product [Dracunculus medinensis]|uniref:GOLD domain-containing protein n=1 Tax=Dracunculus medinensis TaxID=318479 RepID=A0A0N4U4Y2_DRAME|nr:unnamed protein product [Dracunculus medinensis]
MVYASNGICLDHKTVTKGGDLEINFFLVSGSNIIAHDAKTKQGMHTELENGFDCCRFRVNVTASNGEIHFCFDNSFSNTAKVISFQFILVDEQGNVVTRNDTDIKKLAEEIGMKITDFYVKNRFRKWVKVSYARLKVNFDHIEQEQIIFRALESRDKAVLVASLEQVNFWSFCNSIVLISVALIQKLGSRM